MSYSRDRKTFPAYGNAKVLLPGTWRVFWHGGCEKDLWVAGKMSWYQQRDFQSLVMQFSGGKLKQKGFFHSAERPSAPPPSPPEQSDTSEGAWPWFSGRMEDLPWFRQAWETHVKRSHHGLAPDVLVGGLRKYCMPRVASPMLEPARDPGEAWRILESTSVGRRGSSMSSYLKSWAMRGWSMIPKPWLITAGSWWLFEKPRKWGGCRTFWGTAG